jgi:hypothetical protein
VVGRLLEAGLRGASGDSKILRSFTTDKTTSYVISLGEPQNLGGIVGSVWGALSIQNSGVGYSSLSISAHLVRLCCSNGMRAPIPMAEIARRRHRGVDLEALGEATGRSPRSNDASSTSSPFPRSRSIADIVSPAGS